MWCGLHGHKKCTCDYHCTGCKNSYFEVKPDCCSCCQRVKDEEAMIFECDVCAREFEEMDPPRFKTERGLNLHKSRTHGLKASERKVESVEEVRNFQDVIKFAIYRLGTDWPVGEQWKRNAIILSYSGYTFSELAETIEWCAATGKRFDLPWKTIIWVDAYREERGSRLFTGIADPIQAKLDALYVNADNETRKRIRSASSKSDKREALALLKELS